MIGARVVTHSMVLPRSRAGRRRLRLSGSNGVKHRQPVERARLSTAGSGSIPRRGIPAWPGVTRSGWLARFDDDRDLTAIKAALIGVAVLIAMALEVPW